jgi:hypothetical protein
VKPVDAIRIASWDRAITVSFGVHAGWVVSLGFIRQFRLARESVVAGVAATAYGGTSEKGNIDA